MPSKRHFLSQCGYNVQKNLPVYPFLNQIVRIVEPFALLILLLECSSGAIDSFILETKLLKYILPGLILLRQGSIISVQSLLIYDFKNHINVEV